MLNQTKTNLSFHPIKPQVYQPFRPPPKAPLPDKLHFLDSQRRLEALTNRLEALTNRLDSWYEYAPIIPSLVLEDFTPSSIEEATDISGVEQNRLVVVAQVRDSLLKSKIDNEISHSLTKVEQSSCMRLSYLLRPNVLPLLNTLLRIDSMRRELARAVKDFPRSSPCNWSYGIHQNVA